MRGRKPKPTTMKMLTGNPGHRPLNPDEPKPALVAPSCPKTLQGEARKEWRRIVPELMALGLLTRIDRATLTGYCAAWGMYCEATAALGKTGQVIKMSNGMVAVNPYLYIAHKALLLLHKFGSEFGLSPSSRTRIHANPPAEPDALDEFIASGPVVGRIGA